MPKLWAHLGSRPDLARKVRVVEFLTRDSSGASLNRVPEQFESELATDYGISLLLSKGPRDSDKKVVSNILRALRNMECLGSFIWRAATHALPPSEQKGDILGAIVKNKSQLIRLSLDGYFDLYSDMFYFSDLVSYSPSI